MAVEKPTPEEIKEEAKMEEKKLEEKEREVKKIICYKGADWYQGFLEKEEYLSSTKKELKEKLGISLGENIKFVFTDRDDKLVKDVLEGSYDLAIGRQGFISKAPLLENVLKENRIKLTEGPKETSIEEEWNIFLSVIQEPQRGIWENIKKHPHLYEAYKDEILPKDGIWHIPYYGRKTEILKEKDEHILNSILDEKFGPFYVGCGVPSFFRNPDPVIYYNSQKVYKKIFGKIPEKNINGFKEFYGSCAWGIHPDSISEVGENLENIENISGLIGAYRGYIRSMEENVLGLVPFKFERLDPNFKIAKVLKLRDDGSCKYTHYGGFDQSHGKFEDMFGNQIIVSPLTLDKEDIDFIYLHGNLYKKEENGKLKNILGIKDIKKT